MFEIFLIIQILGIFVTFGITFLLILEDSSSNEKLISLSGLCILLCMLAYLFEMFSNSEEAALITVRFQLISLLALNSFLTIYIGLLCFKKLNVPLIFILAIINVVFGIFFSGFRMVPYVFSSVSFVNTGAFPHLVLKEGIVLIINYIYNIILILVQVINIIRYAFSTKNKANKEVIYLLIAYIFPFIAFVYRFCPAFYRFTFIPFTYSLHWSLICFSYIVFRFRLFDSLKIAKEDIINDIDDAFIVLDVNKEFLYANKAAYDCIEELKTPVLIEDTVNTIFKKNKKSIEIGGKNYRINVKTYFDRQRFKGYYIWLYDVTEENIYRQNLIDLKNQAEKANEAKSMFLANMSHEIRTPVNAIMGSVEMILRSKGDSDKIEELAYSIKNASLVEVSLINDILDFSKIEAGKMENLENEYEPGLLIKNITDIVRAKLAEKDVKFELCVNESLPLKLCGDEVHVQQIFMNLLNNAVKYTQQGMIKLNVDWHLQNGMAVLRASVEDTGVGIPENALATLFDSFERADMIKNRTIEGTGLGLAICKKLVEEMGGNILVKSVYGEGSTFSFHIFQKVVDFSPTGDISLLKGNSNLKDEGMTFIAPMAKVLAVDDNLTNIKVIKGLLDLFRINVDTALSGQECLEKMEDNHYHLILMDHMMPIMDGIETTRKIREFHQVEKRAIPVIALTANAIRGSREMFLENGFQDYISKPMEIDTLEDVLVKYLPKEFIHYVKKDDKSDDMSVETIQIAGVDVKAGLANYADNKSRYVQVLKYIFEDGPDQISRMDKMIKNEALEDYCFEVHALKGLALGIGAKHLAKTAADQEEKSRKGDTLGVGKEGPSLLDEYRVLLANIKYVLIDNGIDIEDEEDFPVIRKKLSEEEEEKELISLKKSLELLDQIDSDEKIKLLLQTENTEERKDVYRKIRNAVKEFDYDEAMILIEDIFKQDNEL